MIGFGENRDGFAVNGLLLPKDIDMVCELLYSFGCIHYKEKLIYFL
jgi:hypothetical protein